jgi:hypothetical protein
VSIAAERPLAERLLKAARWYAGHGLRIHPLRRGTKLPILEEWQHRATTDAGTIEGWFREWPDAGVGIVTGAGSGVFVVDVDPRHGGDDSVDDLIAKHGELPETWIVHTANGGRHLYIRHPGGHVGNRTGLWPGVDLRGDGGYVVAPPTVLDGLRAHGGDGDGDGDGGDAHGGDGGDDRGGVGRRIYVWEVGYGPHEVALAAAPEWLLDRIGDRDEMHAATPPDEWAALVRNGAGEGGRNQAVARLAGYLLRRRPAPRVVLELLRAWSESRCRPPLSEEEVIRTVESIARREMERRGDQ